MSAFRTLTKSKTYPTISITRRMLVAFLPPNNLCMRPFHGSSMCSVGATRRRRPSTSSFDRVQGNQDAEHNANEVARRVDAVVDPDIFAAAGKTLFDKITNALSPLEAINDPFVLKHGVDDEGLHFIHLNLGIVHGQYMMQLDIEQQILIFHTPISGRLLYHLSTSGDWLSVQDGHNFEGLLVRDLIRQIQGVPDM